MFALEQKCGRGVQKTVTKSLEKLPRNETMSLAQSFPDVVETAAPRISKWHGQKSH